MNMNPGSDDSIKAGCTCPVLDNNHGRGNGPFWHSEDCPIHGSELVDNTNKQGGEK